LRSSERAVRCASSRARSWGRRPCAGSRRTSRPESTWRKERVAAYGIEPGQLEEHYRQRNTLKVNILPEDIAQAVLHFTSAKWSGKSTGNVLNVDGGVAAAVSRRCA